MAEPWEYLDTNEVWGAIYDAFQLQPLNELAIYQKWIPRFNKRFVALEAERVRLEGEHHHIWRMLADQIERWDKSEAENATLRKAMGEAVGELREMVKNAKEFGYPFGRYSFTEIEEIAASLEAARK